MTDAASIARKLWTGVLNTWSGPASMTHLVVPATVEQFEAFVEAVRKDERNRLADELQKMPLNDTANSIAIWIREGGNA